MDELAIHKLEKNREANDPGHRRNENNAPGGVAQLLKAGQEVPALAPWTRVHAEAFA